MTILLELACTYGLVYGVPALLVLLALLTLICPIPFGLAWPMMMIQVEAMTIEGASMMLFLVMAITFLFYLPSREAVKKQ